MFSQYVTSLPVKYRSLSLQFQVQYYYEVREILIKPIRLGHALMSRTRDLACSVLCLQQASRPLHTLHTHTHTVSVTVQ